MMDEAEYQLLADKTFKRVEDAFADADADVVDCERAGDVITLTFNRGKRCIINTQRPTRQVWVAANARGYHFDYAGGRWVEDKGEHEELFAALSRIVKE